MTSFGQCSLIMLFECVLIFSLASSINYESENRGLNLFNPIVITTWDFQPAADAAWKTIYHDKKSAIDAIERGCSVCEELQCRGTVGFGGSPDETGETTLDAMLMDGVTMDVGAVGALRNVKTAISVARHVLENTAHTFLVGELATNFAIEMGFKNETLETQNSNTEWQKWKSNNCQPNFRKNVTPNPLTSCGPYRPKANVNPSESMASLSNEDNHDTISMVAIDINGHIAAGTSTNGAAKKIPGRVGDSPIAGAGAYADQEVGAAVATGDGDVMMRFLPSFLVVELMRNGVSPKSACEIAIKRIMKYYPNFSGAVMALNMHGQYGVACHGWNTFPYSIGNADAGPALYHISCLGENDV